MTNDWEGWWARKKVRIIRGYLGGFAENGSDQEGCVERYKEEEGVALDITNGGNHGQNFLTTFEYVIIIIIIFLQIIVVAFQLMSYFLLLKYLLFTVLIVVYLFWLVLTL